MAITGKKIDFKINIENIYQTQSDAKSGQNNIKADEDIWNSDSLSYVEYDDGTALIYNGDTPIGWTTIEELKKNEEEIQNEEIESTNSNKTTETLSNGSTKTTETINGITTVTITNQEGIKTYEQTKDGETTITKRYDEETGNILGQNIEYENGYEATISYNINEEGKSVVSKYTLNDATGAAVVTLTTPMKWVRYGDYEYHINENGTLSINPISDYTLSEDGEHYYRVNDDGIVTITSTNGNGTGDIIDYMSVDEAKEAGYIKKGYSFTPKYSLSYDGYYYPTSPNGINPTNSVGSCVWYVVGRINEVRDELGITGDWSYHGYGSEWYSSANSPYGRSNNINDVRAGAVLSYSPNHVVYVEAVNGDSVTISEANVGTSNTAGFKCSTVSKSQLKSLYGKSLQGMVFTLPDE